MNNDDQKTEKEKNNCTICGEYDQFVGRSWFGWCVDCEFKIEQLGMSPEEIVSKKRANIGSKKE